MSKRKATGPGAGLVNSFQGAKPKRNRPGSALLLLLLRLLRIKPSSVEHWDETTPEDQAEQLAEDGVKKFWRENKGRAL